MNVFWTEHALERARDRAMPAGFIENVRAKVYARDWESWFEVDDRAHPRSSTGAARGLRENLLVCAPGGWAVVRLDRDVYVVVSVLTEEQYQFNRSTLWSPTPGRAREKLELEARGEREPLRFSPFARLGRREP